MKCTGDEWDHCRVEKMGCEGCYYTEMKEMKYQANRKIEVLSTGFCFGLLYYILSLGSHPVAYINIPKNHKYYKKEYDEINIDVHGGLTYSSNNLYISETKKIEGWFIGWDYAHYGDYTGFDEIMPQQFRTNEKKWTTEEIFKEVKNACYQIKKEGE